MPALLIPALSGLLFGLGLCLSGMTEADKVLGFLDLFGAWDPSLAFVMGGGILVALPLFLLARKTYPALAPSKARIDAPLVIGAALFGVGWGLVGLCPGPALANLGFLDRSSALFVVAMAAGMGLHALYAQRIPASSAADDGA